MANFRFHLGECIKTSYYWQITIFKIILCKIQSPLYHTDSKNSIRTKLNTGSRMTEKWQVDQPVIQKLDPHFKIHASPFRYSTRFYTNQSMLFQEAHTYFSFFELNTSRDQQASTLKNALYLFYKNIFSNKIIPTHRVNFLAASATILNQLTPK